MNKARRKWLEDIIGKLEEQKDELYQLYEEEQAAYEYASDLESEHDSLEDVIQNLQEILDR